MEKKQTAVEWFLSEFENQIQFKPDSELDVWFKALFPKAKQIEKEQIDNFIDFINEKHFNQFRISKDEAEIY